MNALKLSPRLQACADWVRSGSRLADIGTDHAYLPIDLLLQGVVPFAVAADINPGPLSSARENAGKYGVRERLSLRLSDGLQRLRADEVQDIVIAGMGGELILRMIEETPWLCSGEISLILQPMTKAELLRGGLWQAGFEICRERAVPDRKIYTVMQVRWNGKPYACTPLEQYMGRIDPREEASARYAQKTVTSLQKKLRGLRQPAGEVSETEKLIREIETLYRI